MLSSYVCFIINIRVIKEQQDIYQQMKHYKGHHLTIKGVPGT